MKQFDSFKLMTKRTYMRSRSDGSFYKFETVHFLYNDVDIHCFIQGLLIDLKEIYFYFFAYITLRLCNNI